MIIAMMMMATVAKTTTPTLTVASPLFVLASTSGDDGEIPPLDGGDKMDISSKIDSAAAAAAADGDVASTTTAMAIAAATMHAAGQAPSGKAVADKDVDAAAAAAATSSMKIGQHRSAVVADDDNVSSTTETNSENDDDSYSEGTVLGSSGGSRYVHGHGHNAAMSHLNNNEDRRDGTHHLRSSSGRNCQGLDCNRLLEDSTSERNDHETTMDALYRKVDGMTCKTLQTFPGSEQYRYTAEEGSMLTEEHCQQVCTDLGVSCLGFEVTLKRSVISPLWQEGDNASSDANAAFNGTMYNQTRCKFWNRRPVDFESSTDQDIVLSSCIIKEYLAYNTTACQIGFKPSPGGSNIEPTLLDNMPSLQECSKECERRDIAEYPVFGNTNTDSEICFGYMQMDKQQCMMYHTPIFVIEGVTSQTQTQTGTDRESYEALSLDDNVCLVRPQAVLVHPST